MAQTEGGEALPFAGTVGILDASGRNGAPGELIDERDRLEDFAPAGGSHWYALWTRSHCERLVLNQLTAKGFETFLPTLDIWSRRGGIRHRIQTPMFPGYLFVHRAMDKTNYIEVCKTRGLVRILGERWDRLAVVPDGEIEAIQTVLQAGAPVVPHTFLREGQRVRIIHGPLTDVEGILVRQNPTRGMLVLSVVLLQQSVAVEVDCTWVVPV